MLPGKINSKLNDTIPFYVSSFSVYAYSDVASATVSFTFTKDCDISGVSMPSSVNNVLNGRHSANSTVSTTLRIDHSQTNSGSAGIDISKMIVTLL